MLSVQYPELELKRTHVLLLSVLRPRSCTAAMARLCLGGIASPFRLLRAGAYCSGAKVVCA